MRNFAVIGLGSFGHFTARFLAERGLEVLGVDKDEQQVDLIKPYIEKAVIADATNREMLEQIGVQDMDAVIVSVGDKIDMSILITLYLKELKVRHIIVKAITEDHGKILHIIGATEVIFPERDMAAKIAEQLANPHVLDTLRLGPDYSIVELVPPKGFMHKELRDLDIRRKYNVQVLAIKELVPENLVVVPPSDFIIKESDTMLVVGRLEDIEKLEKIS
jgi:trk system potassium uptake protein TrkA